MMKVENIVVLAVQETHLDEKLLTEIERSFNKYLTIENSSIPENPTQSGRVTIVLNKALIDPEELSSHMLIQGRAVLTKLQWANVEKLVILNRYALNNRHSHSDFWKQIEIERQSKRLPKPDILLGDFNIMEDAIYRSPPNVNKNVAVEALCKIRATWNL